MSVSSLVPQEIVDEIIADLRHDHDTLKKCALVSHSFLPYCRKLLFSTIRLDNSFIILKLHNVLKSNPRLSIYIQELCIDQSYSHGSNAINWLCTDTVLPNVLSSLPDLRCFTFQSTKSLNCQRFSEELTKSLINLLKSPTLTSVHFIHLQDMPLAILRSIIQVKKLHLHRVSFKPDCDSSAHDTVDKSAVYGGLQLEYLHISNMSLDLTRQPWLVLNASKLRRLSINLFVPGMSVLGLPTTNLYPSYQETAQAIIDRCAGSIEHVCWHRYQAPQGYKTPDLSTIMQLKSLVFTINHFALQSAIQCFQPQLRSIVDILRNPSITKNLQKLTIGIRFYNHAIEQPSTSTWYTACATLKAFDSWSELDTVTSILREVNIVVIVHIDCTMIDVAGRHLGDLSRQWLPRTHERGILKAEVLGRDLLGEMSLENF